MSWGSGGQALGSRPSQPHIGTRAVGAGGASVPVLPNRNGTRRVQRERSPTPESDDADEGDEDDDEYIEYDSD